MLNKKVSSKWDRRNASVLWVCMLVSIFVATLLSDEVCKLTYTGYPEDLNDTALVVPDNIVALSEYIYVGSPVFVNENITNEPTIFFVIDHSGSMFEKYDPSIDPNAPYDLWGNRFNVTRDLIDTLYKKVPKAEVGVAVFRQLPYFFLEDDPELFESFPGEDYWGYIPLMRLDSIYSPYNKMGYQIIKDYLKTDTVTLEYPPYWDFVDLEYIPTDFWMNGTYTNINAAHECAKNAMLNSQHPKDQHFVIFISDGLASWPDDAVKDNYIKGTGMPTTYTVFFTKDSVPPPSLQQMTDNIRSNGYSTSNPGSQLWAFDNTDYPKLMSFLMDSVIFSIDLIQTNNPMEITINGQTNPNPWDSVGFLFNDLFPLIGDSTPFVLDIDYHVWVDSITQNGDTISYEKDTTTHIEFDVIVEDNTVLSDSIITECWERELQFYHDGQPITMANETMDKLEIRFKEQEVDIWYGYKDVSVEITNTEASNPDLETFTLEDKGDYFACTFPRKIDQSPDKNDNTLGHAVQDSFVATFRNPKLPLDTVRVSIPFKITTLIELKGGLYFDTDADGYIDSIFVQVDGDLTEGHVSKLKDLISLPAHRGFQNSTFHLSDGGLYILTEQKDKSSPAKMVTYVTDDDVLIAKEAILSEGGWLLADTVPILDRVAPIIMKAHLIDYEDDLLNDTLTVDFSEPIHKVTKYEPFYFKSRVNDDLYTADIRLTGSDTDQMEFYVRSFTGQIGEVDQMSQGDSIWIYWEGDQVTDLEFNSQHNEKNRRRKLTVKKKLLPFTLIPDAVSPLDIGELDNAVKIPDFIIEALDKAGVLKDMYLEENKDGDHVGMILQVKPDNPEKLHNFKLVGHVTLFDAVGNEVIFERKMGYHDGTGSLYYVWNRRNSNARYVGPGTYVAIFTVTPYTGSSFIKRPVEVLRHFVGVKD